VEPEENGLQDVRSTLTLTSGSKHGNRL